MGGWAEEAGGVEVGNNTKDKMPGQGEGDPALRFQKPWGSVGSVLNLTACGKVGSVSQVTAAGQEGMPGEVEVGIRKSVLYKRVVMQWNRLPKEWWSHHPWRCSRTVKMWH